MRKMGRGNSFEGGFKIFLMNSRDDLFNKNLKFLLNFCYNISV